MKHYPTPTRFFNPEVQKLKEENRLVCERCETWTADNYAILNGMVLCRKCSYYNDVEDPYAEVTKQNYRNLPNPFSIERN